MLFACYKYTSTIIIIHARKVDVILLAHISHGGAVVFSTRLKSSYEQRDARLAALMMRVG